MRAKQYLITLNSSSKKAVIGARIEFSSRPTDWRESICPGARLQMSLAMVPPFDSDVIFSTRRETSGFEAGASTSENHSLYNPSSLSFFFILVNIETKEHSQLGRLTYQIYSSTPYEDNFLKGLTQWFQSFRNRVLTKFDILYLRRRYHRKTLEYEPHNIWECVRCWSEQCYEWSDGSLVQKQTKCCEDCWKQDHEKLRVSSQQAEVRSLFHSN